jgi:hypothetical protein
MVCLPRFRNIYLSNPLTVINNPFHQCYFPVPAYVYEAGKEVGPPRKMVFGGGHRNSAISQDPRVVS